MSDRIYQAILRAADHIEAYPSEFSFSSTDIPDTPFCGSPGCALGWIAHFSGITEQAWKTGRFMLGSVVGVDSSEFYDRMFEFELDWTDDAVACARALRFYAHKYHKPVVAQAHQLVPYQEQFAVGAWDVFKPKALSI